MTIEVLTAALVVITGIYARFTHRMMRASEQTVQAMREQNVAFGRPYINVGVLKVPHNDLFFLRIANTGRTGAENVRLELDRDFYQYGDKNGTNLRSVVAFQEPIAQLPPGAELVFGLGLGFGLLGKQADPALTPSVFTVTAAYSYGEQTVTEKTIIDLRPYHSSMNAPDHPVANELKKLREGELKGLRDTLKAIVSREA